jgi:hypothetical protein
MLQKTWCKASTHRSVNSKQASPEALRKAAEDALKLGFASKAQF